ncbi:MAG: riboflavin synthase [Brevinematales bacterium]|nr:riboflavin synthase [Brevinematales bacterium]
MFSGIVKHTGVLVRGLNGNYQGKIVVKAKEIFDFTYLGGSIAVNGVCLSVVNKENGNLEFFVSYETSERSTVSTLKEGTILNLELPLTPSTFLDGHIVLGHVDTTGEIMEIDKIGDGYKLKISVPKHFIKYVVYKGSIAVDGISLTVYEVDDISSSFSIAVIPITYETTNLKFLRNGDLVNIEFDILAKYVERIMLLGNQKGIMDKLKDLWET